MPKEPNVCSKVLTNEEHNRLFRLLGDQCVTLATGVVQLYLAEPSDRPHWTKKYTGVVGFIKDYAKHSFFIRLYDIQRNVMIWQQEIYNELETFTLYGSFIFFEAHECVAGLCFANDDDAVNFKNAVQAKLDKRNSQVIRQEQQIQISRPMTVPQTKLQKNVNLAADLHLQTTEVKGGGAPELCNRLTMDDIDAVLRASTTKNSSNGKKNKKDKKDKKKKNGGGGGGARLEISAPIAGTFKVETHVGADSGIDFNDPAILELLKRAGLQQGRLGDVEKNFIVDFIKQKGGMAAVQQHYGPLADGRNNIQQQQQQQQHRRPSLQQQNGGQNGGMVHTAPIPPPPLAQPELPPIHSMKTANQIQSSRQQLQQMQLQQQLANNMANGGMNGSATMRVPTNVQQMNPHLQINSNNLMRNHQQPQRPPVPLPPPPVPAPELPPRDTGTVPSSRPQLPPRPATQPQRVMNGSAPPPLPSMPPQSMRNGSVSNGSANTEMRNGSGPPPPPPLPPSAPPPPPMAHQPSGLSKTAPLPSSVVEPGRNHLMDAIRKHGGSVSLRHIRSTSSDESGGGFEPTPPAPVRRESSTISGGDPRDTMLAQIKDGTATTRLKKVGPPEANRPEPVEDTNDLASQLRRALASRQGVLQPSSDEEDSDSDEDEWTS